MGILRTATTGPGTAPDATAASTCGSILVIDDEESVCNALTALRKAEGFSVASASSGKEGARFPRRGPFDVVIADLIMRGLGGRPGTTVPSDTSTIKRFVKRGAAILAVCDFTPPLRVACAGPAEASPTPQSWASRPCPGTGKLYVARPRVLAIVAVPAPQPGVVEAKQVAKQHVV